jgi:diguanylate cyclase
MQTVDDCLLNAHDLRLVGLAAIVYALAPSTVISLLHHVRRSAGMAAFAIQDRNLLPVHA